MNAKALMGFALIVIAWQGGDVQTAIVAAVIGIPLMILL